MGAAPVSNSADRSHWIAMTLDPDDSVYQHILLVCWVWDPKLNVVGIEFKWKQEKLNTYEDFEGIKKRKTQSTQENISIHDFEMPFMVGSMKTKVLPSSKHPFFVAAVSWNLSIGLRHPQIRIVDLDLTRFSKQVEDDWYTTWGEDFLTNDWMFRVFLKFWQLMMDNLLPTSTFSSLVSNNQTSNRFLANLVRSWKWDTAAIRCPWCFRSGLPKWCKIPLIKALSVDSHDKAPCKEWDHLEFTKKKVKQK